MADAHPPTKRREIVSVDVTAAWKIKPYGETLVQISCALPDLVVHDTYVSRSLDVELLRHTWADGPVDAHLQRRYTSDDETTALTNPELVAVGDEDAEGERVANESEGITQLGFAYARPFDAAYPTRDLVLHYSWDSIDATAGRDIIFVVIGTLVAIAAAALIEAVRPYIDRS